MHNLWMKIKWELWGWWWVIQHNLPYLCDCGHICARKHVRTKTTTWGQSVTYCHTCYEEYFYE